MPILTVTMVLPFEPVQSKCTWTCHKTSHLIRQFRGKCRRTAVDQDRDTHFVRACAIAMHLNILQKPLYTDIYRKNATPQSEPRTQTATLCEPARSKCMSSCHKSHFIQKFTCKMPRPGLSPERGHTLCASLRNRHAFQPLARATLYGNLQEKCCGPAGVP